MVALPGAVTDQEAKAQDAREGPTRHKEKVLHGHRRALGQGQGWHFQPWKFSKPRVPQGNFEISSALSDQVGKEPIKAPPSLKHQILPLR